MVIDCKNVSLLFRYMSLFLCHFKLFLGGLENLLFIINKLHLGLEEDEIECYVIVSNWHS